jgi:hypothetical protein
VLEREGEKGGSEREGAVEKREGEIESEGG